MDNIYRECDMSGRNKVGWGDKMKKAQVLGLNDMNRFDKNKMRIL